MKFRNGTLFSSLLDAKIYLVENGLKRPIANPDVLALINAKHSDVVIVSEQEAQLHKEGEVLDYAL